MRPRITASCFDSGPGNHGSATLEVTGNAVSVPALGDEDGDGVPDGGSGGGAPPGGTGAQGERDFPGAGFGPPTAPLRSGGCARVRPGTRRSDTLNGTAAGDLIFGLGGDSLIRGHGRDDCVIGGPGSDRLLGGPGDDRLTAGAGADELVGGAGMNRDDAGAGDDVIRAANGRAELVSCGSGRDTALADRSDRVRSCEVVRPSR
ncbi:MAG: hypothetical protein AB1416_05645 [Actinomycetota bacterium]